MPYYTKAYPVLRLREFAGWPGDDLEDDDIVFLHQDYSVRRSSVPEDLDSIVLASGAADFKAFCETSLAFVLPEWADP